MIHLESRIVIATSQPHGLTTLQTHNLTASKLTASQPHSITTSHHHNLTASQPHNLTSSQPQSVATSQPVRREFPQKTTRAGLPPLDSFLFLSATLQGRPFNTKCRICMRNCKSNGKVFATLVDDDDDDDAKTRFFRLTCHQNCGYRDATNVRMAIAQTT